MNQLLSLSKDFHKIWYLNFFSKICPENLTTRINSTLIEDQYIISIISRSIRLEWETFRITFVEKNETGISCLILFFENRVVCEIKWENILQPDRSQMTIWFTRIASWVPKATNTLSEYVILIALPLQKLWNEGASILRFTCFPYLVLKIYSLKPSIPKQYIYTEPYFKTLGCRLSHRL
jgi:hypothetical protein